MHQPAAPLAFAAAIDVNIAPNHQFVFLKFSRNDAVLKSTNASRKDKSLRCELPLLSPTNLISHLVFSTENPASEIKIMNARIVAGVKSVQLQFRVESDNTSASSTVFIDWFVVSKDIPVDCVHVCMPCPASATILQHGKRRGRLASIAEGTHTYDDRNTDVPNSVPLQPHLSVPATCVSKSRKKTIIAGSLVFFDNILSSRLKHQTVKSSRV